jgi:uncharacterized protein YcgI (DUF1989 family)
MSSQVVIPARKGIAFEVKAGAKLKIINTHGSQVLDTWAFSLADLNDYMSMEHTRSAVSKLTPGVGDTFVTNNFTPMLTLLEDTSGGVHDTLMCSCSKVIYQRLKYEGYHDSCEDNFHAALAAVGLSRPFVPSPLNLFMNYPVSGQGVITREPPISTPGSHVLFDVRSDLLMVISACPQDIQTVNGLGRKPTDAAYEVL